MSECLIEQTKRTRVGGDGPKRHSLKPYALLGTVSQEVLDELNAVTDSYKGNDIGGDNYNISQNCNYEEVFNVADHYRQVLFQESTDVGDEVVDEHLYTQWSPNYDIPNTRNFLDTMFAKTYRFRVSEMKAPHELNWHIDTCTSVICRAQICLNETDSLFEIRERKELHQISMKPGEVWFVNTGWSHRVVNPTTTRRVAILGFDFKDLYGRSDLLK